MNSQELAEEVTVLINQCSSRILVTGDEQYSRGDTQRFESLPLDEVFQSSYEELQDLIAYASMIHIRLRKLEKEVLQRLNHLRGLDCL